MPHTAPSPEGKDLRERQTFSAPPNLPITVGSRSMNTALGTCLPAPVSLKKVLNESSPPPMVESLGICPSGWIPCSRQYNSQQALPTWTPAWPMWIERHSRCWRGETGGEMLGREVSVGNFSFTAAGRAISIIPIDHHLELFIASLALIAHRPPPNMTTFSVPPNIVIRRLSTLPSPNVTLKFLEIAFIISLHNINPRPPSPVAVSFPLSVPSYPLRSHSPGALSPSRVRCL